MIKLFGSKMIKFIFFTVLAGIILAQSCSLKKLVGEPPNDTTMHRHFSFRQDILMFPYIGLCYKLKILLGWWQVWPHSLFLNKFDRGPPGSATHQIIVLDSFLYIGLCKSYYSLGGTTFGDMATIWINSDRWQLGDATYKISRLYVLLFQTRRLFYVSHIRLH